MILTEEATIKDLDGNVKELVNEGVNDIILKYQEKFGITDGGIDPLMSLELDDIEEKLVDFLKKAFPVPEA